MLINSTRSHTRLVYSSVARGLAGASAVHLYRVSVNEGTRHIE